MSARNSTFQKPLRIASLSPSCTSILWAVGAGAHLVAVTQWCAEVAPVKRLPAYGDCWRIESIEKLAKLKPTLIVGSVPFKAETVVRLLEIPAQFLALNPRTLLDIERDIRTLAQLTGRQANGEKLIHRMKREFAAIASRARELSCKPRIYAEAWPNPRISSPPWVAELIRIGGGIPLGTFGTRVSDEEVAAANPDTILLAWTATGKRANARKTLAHPKWQRVSAIRNRRVFVVQDELLNTPGPALVDGAREILRIVKEFSGAGA